MNKIANYLIKRAADVTKEKAMAESALEAYKNNPNAASLAALAKAVKNIQDNNPTHLNGGYYTGLKDTISRANEQWGRGNYVRGALGKALGVPIMALADTVVAPYTALGRALNPSVNMGFDNVEELAGNNPDDVKHNMRAAGELIKLMSQERDDPTNYFERTNNLIKQLKSNKSYYIPKAVAGTLSGSYLPFVTEGVADLTAAPGNALLNGIGANGKSRAEYEAEQIAKNKK